jgi:hypothetical protein
MCKAYIVNNVLTEDIVFTDMQQILIKYIDKKGEPPRQAFLLELNKKDKSLTYEVVEGVINVKDHKQKTVDLIEPLVTIKL